MPVQVTIEQIVRLAPSIRSSHREAFRLGQAVFDTFGISESALRVAHFMAQILHESGAFTVQFENLYYSPQRLPKVWPKRFKPNGPLDPAKYAYNPQKLANEVYGGRMGNIGPNDGFTYRGRGLLQLTGRDSYAEATAILRQSFPEAPDFTFDPDAVIGADWCIQVAAAEWFSKGCNELADQDAIRSITKAINGGLIGLADRIEWSKRTRSVWH